MWGDGVKRSWFLKPALKAPESRGGDPGSAPPGHGRGRGKSLQGRGTQAARLQLHHPAPGQVERTETLLTRRGSSAPPSAARQRNPDKVPRQPVPVESKAAKNPPPRATGHAGSRLSRQTCLQFNRRQQPDRPEGSARSAAAGLGSPCPEGRAGGNKAAAGAGGRQRQEPPPEGEPGGRTHFLWALSFLALVRFFRACSASTAGEKSRGV